MFGTIKDYSEASISDCITYQVKNSFRKCGSLFGIHPRDLRGTCLTDRRLKTF